MFKLSVFFFLAISTLGCEAQVFKPSEEMVVGMETSSDGVCGEAYGIHVNPKEDVSFKMYNDGKEYNALIRGEEFLTIQVKNGCDVTIVLDGGVKSDVLFSFDSQHTLAVDDYVFSGDYFWTKVRPGYFTEVVVKR